MALTKIRLSQVSGSLKKGEQSAFAFGTGTEAGLKYLTFDTADEEIQVDQDVIGSEHIRIKADNKELSVGAADDLKIMHNGTDSALINATGNLAAASDAFVIMDQALAETGLTYTKDGSIDLYYDNSKKFETTSVGATVTGILSADGVDVGDGENIRIGASQDLQRERRVCYRCFNRKAACQVRRRSAHVEHSQRAVSQGNQRCCCRDQLRQR